MNPVIVYKNRTNIVRVSLGIDVSEDVLTSEIRTGRSRFSTKIATWEVSFDTDGVDGEVILTLDDDETKDITHTNGFMDIKRVSNSEPLTVFSDSIPVTFKDTVTE
jgi:hypothetical protein